MALLHEVLGGPVRLAHNGGLLGGAQRSFTAWHDHRSDAPEPRPARQGRIARVLANVSLDDSNGRLGALLVRPRALGDSLTLPDEHVDREWPDQAAFRCPPGSIVVFDQSLLHAARPVAVSVRAFPMTLIVTGGRRQYLCYTR